MNTGVDTLQLIQRKITYLWGMNILVINFEIGTKVYSSKSLLDLTKFKGIKNTHSLVTKLQHSTLNKLSLFKTFSLQEWCLWIPFQKRENITPCMHVIFPCKMDVLIIRFSSICSLIISAHISMFVDLRYPYINIMDFKIRKMLRY